MKIIARALALATLLLLLDGCATLEGPTARVVDEVIASNIGALAWAAAWRSFVFGGLGFVLGFAAFLGLRKRELLRWNWRHAKWLRGLAGVIMVMAFAATGAWLGFWRGAAHGAEDMIREGQLGTEVLPAVGEAGSLLLATVYVASEVVEDDEAVPDDAQLEQIAGRVAGYAKGEWAMGTAELEARLARVRSRVVGIGVELAKREVHARYPALEGTVADELLPWALDKLSVELGGKAVEAAVDNELAAIVAKPIQEVLETLDEGAEREGDPSTLSHVELRGHVVEVGLIPMLTGPIEKLARSQQLTGVLALLLLVLLTVLGFRVADYFYERRQAKPSEAC